MDLEKKLRLVHEVGEEIITHDELKTLLQTNSKPIAYDGFEPSGKIHIAQGILRAINVNKLTAAGIRFKMFVADWHAWANHKMGGDLDKIQTVGNYFIEVWKQTGMDQKKVEFIWASDLLNNREYWKTVMQIARHSTLQRVLRTTQIMGRNESDALSASQIIYPCMQAADIFELHADIAQLGMDQRKVNVLAREVAEKIGKKKPVAVHHHMLLGLNPDKINFGGVKVELSSEPPVEKTVLGELKIRIVRFNESGVTSPLEQVGTKNSKIHHNVRLETTFLGKKESFIIYSGVTRISNFRYRPLEIDPVKKRVLLEIFPIKMSKSNPDSAIFMTDSRDEIARKINKAYCMEKTVAENPVLEYCKYIIFNHPQFKKLKIERPQKFGGNVEYDTYLELEQDFANGKLHPMDLKKTVANEIDRLVSPVRDHFEKNKKARELLNQVQSFSVTR